GDAAEEDSFERRIADDQGLARFPLEGVDEAEDQRDEHRGKGQGRYEPADDGTAEEDGEEHAGLHHYIVVGHRPVSDLRAGIAVLGRRLVEQVVELLVGHDRLVAAGLGALVDRPVHHWVTHGRDPFDLSRLHVRTRRRTRVESRLQCRRMTWTVTEDPALEATSVARS